MKDVLYFNSSLFVVLSYTGYLYDSGITNLDAVQQPFYYSY